MDMPKPTTGVDQADTHANRDLAEAAASPSGTSTPIAGERAGGEEGDQGDQDDDEEDTDIPLTMAASVVLADLPQSAASALERAAQATGPQAERKVVVRFKAVGSAAQLAQDVCKISAARRFEEVVRYLRRKLRCGEADSVFLYVNSAFAPSLDEVVGNLHQVSTAFLYAYLLSSVWLVYWRRAGWADWVQCFKNAQDQLVVAYSMTPAFG